MAKKRANGEGNIRKRKDGRWEGRYTAGTDPETGKQIFKNVLGKTQAEVKEKLKKALEEAKKIDVTRTGKYTVEQWMDEWFENVCKIKVRPAHRSRLKWLLREFCVSDFRQNQEYHIINVHGGAYSPWLHLSRKVGTVCAPYAA